MLQRVLGDCRSIKEVSRNSRGIVSVWGVPGCFKRSQECFRGFKWHFMGFQGHFRVFERVFGCTGYTVR